MGDRLVTGPRDRDGLLTCFGREAMQRDRVCVHQHLRGWRQQDDGGGQRGEGGRPGMGGSHCIPQARGAKGRTHGAVICVQAEPDWDFR